MTKSSARHPTPCCKNKFPFLKIHASKKTYQLPCYPPLQIITTA